MSWSSMAWNLFLALLPLVLSIWLFRGRSSQTIVWWLGLLVFVAFLPNAPYILTDLLHLVRELQSVDSLLVGTLVKIPKYLIFVVIGFEAYVLSLLNFGYYLRKQGLGATVLSAELVLHALSAIGVYLGRFERLNSWNIVTNPHHVVHSLVENLLDLRPLVFMTIGFGAIAVLYWVFKQLTLAVLLRRRYATVLHHLAPEQRQALQPEFLDDLD